MLLVVSLLSVIGIAVYRAFASGLKIWERRPQSVVQEDTLIFLDKMNQDLQNTMVYSKIPFEGNEKRMAFATLVKTPIFGTKKFGENEYVNQIGKVEYYFDGTVNKLYRRQANYSQALNNKFFPARILVNDIKSVKFFYYYRKGKGYVIENKKVTVTPEIVSVEITFNDKNGIGNMTRVMNVPVGRSKND